MEHIVHYYKEGYSPEMLFEKYPTLSPPLIRQVIDFYVRNQAEVDAFVAECEAEIERQRAATPPVTDWNALQRRFDAMSRGETN